MDTVKEDKSPGGGSDATLELGSKKRGRPRKNTFVFGGGKGLLVAKASGGKVRRREGRMKVTAEGGTCAAAADIVHVGQPVHGVLDGSFDAGYFLTVRVGSSQTLLRGAVFEPSLSAIVTKGNDIAPSVAFHKRQDHLMASPPNPNPNPNSNHNPNPQTPLVWRPVEALSNISSPRLGDPIAKECEPVSHGPFPHRIGIGAELASSMCPPPSSAFMPRANENHYTVTPGNQHLDA